MPTTKEIQQMKKMVSQARAAEQKAQGVLEELERELKEEWECDTVEDAEKLLASMRDQLEELDAKAQEEYESFKAEWDAWAEGMA